MPFAKLPACGDKIKKCGEKNWFIEAVGELKRVNDYNEQDCSRILNLRRSLCLLMSFFVFMSSARFIWWLYKSWKKKKKHRIKKILCNSSFVVWMVFLIFCLIHDRYFCQPRLSTQRVTILNHARVAECAMCQWQLPEGPKSLRVNGCLTLWLYFDMQQIYIQIKPVQIAQLQHLLK